MMIPLTILIGLVTGPDSPPAPVRSVPQLDLERYAGQWYEIAKFPNRFQARCRTETTAQYERLPNGQLRVINTCKDSAGGVIRAEGRARLADARGPTSQLKVRFAPAFLSWLPMVWGDYWVLDITPEYDAVLVGTPSREYLWILARTAQLGEATYQRLVAAAAAQGFDVSQIVRNMP
jgi:apolipoprotein D and lipocalin family protein